MEEKTAENQPEAALPQRIVFVEDEPELSPLVTILKGNMGTYSQVNLVAAPYTRGVACVALIAVAVQGFIYFPYPWNIIVLALVSVGILILYLEMLRKEGQWDHHLSNLAMKELSQVINMVFLEYPVFTVETLEIFNMEGRKEIVELQDRIAKYPDKATAILRNLAKQLEKEYFFSIDDAIAWMVKSLDDKPFSSWYTNYLADRQALDNAIDDPRFLVEQPQA